MTCDEVTELTTEYLLGRTEEGETQAIEAHLASCAACRAEVGGLRAAAESLLLAATPLLPPAGLKERLLAQVQAETSIPGGEPARSTHLAPQRPVPSKRTSPSPLVWVGLALALLALGAALGSLGWALQLGAQLQEHRSLAQEMLRENRTLAEQVALQDRYFTLLTSPHRVTKELVGTSASPQAKGRLILDPNEDFAMLVASDLPPLPPGGVYQLWLIRDGQRANGGLFTVDRRGTGRLMVQAPAVLATYREIGVTQEPEGGSPGPSGTKVLGGGL